MVLMEKVYETQSLPPPHLLGLSKCPSIVCLLNDFKKY